MKVAGFFCILITFLISGLVPLPADDFRPSVVYTVSSQAAGWSLKKGNAKLGFVERKGYIERLLGADGTPVVDIETSVSSSSFPRDISMSGKFFSQAATVSVRFTEVAPPAPIGIEELNIDEEELSSWLKASAVSTNIKSFRTEFTRETKGRKLKKWYEVSGRVRDGVLEINGEQAARFYTGYQLRKNGAYKLHHRGDTLELADVITGSGTLVSYRCGCHGYSEFCPKVVLNGFEYSVALEANGGFIDWGYGSLFRKPLKFTINDVRGKEFAAVEMSYPDDKNFANTVYRFFIRKDGQRIEFARVFMKNGKTRVEVAHEPKAFELLDQVLAMMPTQVTRGDRVRDSLLGELETTLDWIKLIEAPTKENLADAMSGTDAATAPTKVSALLNSDPLRFKRRRASDEAPPGVVCSDGGCKFVPEAR